MAVRTISTQREEQRRRGRKGRKEGGIGIVVAVGDGWREKAPKDGGDARGITSDQNRRFGEGREMHSWNLVPIFGRVESTTGVDSNLDSRN